MLDLDSLAEKHAKSTNEQETKWREALWSTSFQSLAQNMSDGEVEILLSSCPSLLHFDSVLRYLLAQPDHAAYSPYVLLQKGAADKGLSLADWIRRLPTGGT